MPSLKQLKQAEKGVARLQRAAAELQTLAGDIERCEKTMGGLKQELQSINSKHQGRRTTREDLAYLTDLLRCGNKKLVWEKQMASVQKRTPIILETISRLMNDPQIPPNEQLRAEMLRSLQTIQATMERLQSAKSD